MHSSCWHGSWINCLGSNQCSVHAVDQVWALACALQLSYLCHLLCPLDQELLTGLSSTQHFSQNSTFRLAAEYSLSQYTQYRFMSPAFNSSSSPTEWYMNSGGRVDDLLCSHPIWCLPVCFFSHKTFLENEWKLPSSYVILPLSVPVISDTDYSGCKPMVDRKKTNLHLIPKPSPFGPMVLALSRRNIGLESVQILGLRPGQWPEIFICLCFCFFCFIQG